VRSSKSVSLFLFHKSLMFVNRRLFLPAIRRSLRDSQNFYSIRSVQSTREDSSIERRTLVPIARRLSNQLSRLHHDSVFLATSHVELASQTRRTRFHSLHRTITSSDADTFRRESSSRRSRRDARRFQQRDGRKRRIKSVRLSPLAPRFCSSVPIRSHAPRRHTAPTGSAFPKTR